MTKDEAVKIALRIIDNDIDVKVNCSGAKQVIQDALTKQLAIRPIPLNNNYGIYECASCGHIFTTHDNYCEKCGQKIEWT